jgi:hypothetical protein
LLYFDFFALILLDFLQGSDLSGDEVEKDSEILRNKSTFLGFAVSFAFFQYICGKDLILVFPKSRRVHRQAVQDVEVALLELKLSQRIDNSQKVLEIVKPFNKFEARSDSSNEVVEDSCFRG